MDIGGIVGIVVRLARGVISLGIFVARLIAEQQQRECFIAISNNSSNYTLCNPRMYIKRGKCRVPLPPSIGPAKIAAALFTKRRKKSNGCVGVITYDLLDNLTEKSSQKVAVLFKVTFNQKQSPSMCALGIVDISTECDLGLCIEMSKGPAEVFARGTAEGPGVTHVGQTVTVKASMCSGPEAIVKVEVCDN